MPDKLKAHDCISTVLQVEGARIKFLCAFCHRVSNEMDEQGMYPLSPHGSDKHLNFTPLEVLELAMKHVKKFRKA